MSNYGFKILMWILKAGTEMLLLYMDTQPKVNTYLSFEHLENSKLLLSVVFVRPGLLIKTNRGYFFFFVPNTLFLFIVKSNFSLFQEELRNQS